MTNAYKIGGCVVDTATSIVTLTAPVVNTDRYQVLQAPFGTSYAVPANKKLVVTKVVVNGGASSWTCGFGYATNANTNATSGAVTAWVELIYYRNLKQLTSGVTYEYDVYFEIPTGKYPHVHGGDVSTDMYVGAYGVLVDA